MCSRFYRPIPCNLGRGRPILLPTVLRLWIANGPSAELDGRAGRQRHPARPAQGARRQHAVRDLPRTRPLAAPARRPPTSPSRSALHPNTVRPHLERMRDIGLLDVAVGGRGDVGRPQHRYSIAADAPSLGFEPPTMPMLARMVLPWRSGSNASADDADAVGRERGGDPSRAATGRRRRRSKRSCPTSTASASIRSSPTSPTTPTPRSSPSPTVRSPISPSEHPDLVCGLHRGLVAGFVAEMADTEVREFCSVTSRTPCRVTVAATLRIELPQ